MEKMELELQESNLFVRRMMSNNARDGGGGDGGGVARPAPPPNKPFPFPKHPKPRPQHLPLKTKNDDEMNFPPPPKNTPPPKPPRQLQALQRQAVDVHQDALTGLTSPELTHLVSQKFLKDFDPKQDLYEEPPDFIPPFPVPSPSGKPFVNSNPRWSKLC